MITLARGQAFRRSIRAALLTLAPLTLAFVQACSGVDSGTEVIGASAGAAAIGGTTGGTGGATGGAGGVTGGVGGSVAGTGGAGGVTAGTGGALGGSGGAGGAVGGSAGIGFTGGSAGVGGATGGSAGTGGSLGGAAGAGGASGGAAGSGTGGSAGWAPATDRMSAWNNETYGCGNCHGDEGEGIVNRGPEIKHPNRELFDFMTRTGDATPLAAYRDPMKPVTQAMISDAILNDIYTWLNSFPKPATGPELFADYCSYCHGADGRGGTTQGYASAMHSAPFDEMGADFLEHVRDGHVRSGAGGAIDVSEREEWMPPFPATVLTDQEVGLIEAWLPK